MNRAQAQICGRGARAPPPFPRRRESRGGGPSQPPETKRRAQSTDPFLRSIPLVIPAKAGIQKAADSLAAQNQAPNASADISYANWGAACPRKRKSARSGERRRARLAKEPVENGYRPDDEAPGCERPPYQRGACFGDFSLQFAELPRHAGFGFDAARRNPNSGFYG